MGCTSMEVKPFGPDQLVVTLLLVVVPVSVTVVVEQVSLSDTVAVTPFGDMVSCITATLAVDLHPLDEFNAVTV